MKRSSLFLLIDVLMVFSLAVMSGLGLLIKFILVPGSKRQLIYGRNTDLSYLGMDRHEWGTVHLIIAIIFIILLIIHVTLHWNCFIACIRKTVHTKTGTVIFLSVCALIILFFTIFPFLINIRVNDREYEHKNYMHRRYHRPRSSLVRETGVISIFTDIQSINNIER